MAIEDTLQSIDTSLKLIVTILQSAGAISAQPGPDASAAAAQAETTKKTRAKKDNSTNADPANGLGTVEGDPEGTRYWVSEELATVYAQKPGDPDPQPQSFKIESAAHYTAKKAEFAAKKPAVDAQATGAAATPAKTTPDASSASSVLEWKSVLVDIQALNKSEKTGHGRDGVLSVLKHFGLEGQKVPALEGLGKHAEVQKFVRDLLAGGAAEDDLGI